VSRDGKAPVPNRLREHRLGLGLEQWNVAERISALTKDGTLLDAHAVSRHERGLHKPGRIYRQLYCQVYQATEDELWPHRPALLERGDEQPDRQQADHDPVLAAAWDRGGTVEASLALDREWWPGGAASVLAVVWDSIDRPGAPVSW